MVLPTRVATVLEAFRCFRLLFCKALGSFLAMAKGLLTTKPGHMDEEEFQTFTLPCMGQGSSRTSFYLLLPYFSPAWCLRLLHVGFANILPTPIQVAFETLRSYIY